jgi:trigger factor
LPVTFPADYDVADLAGATVDYDVTVKGARRKELLPLDDEFAKEVSDVADARGAAGRRCART